MGLKHITGHTTNQTEGPHCLTALTGKASSALMKLSALGKYRKPWEQTWKNILMKGRLHFTVWLMILWVNNVSDLN